jgi:hypothetical protein
MSLSNATKESIDKLLDNATRGKGGVPGIVYAVINKQGDTVYEKAFGVKSLNEPTQKVSFLPLHLIMHH